MATPNPGGMTGGGTSQACMFPFELASKLWSHCCEYWLAVIVHITIEVLERGNIVVEKGEQRQALAIDGRTMIPTLCFPVTGRSTLECGPCSLCLSHKL